MEVFIANMEAQQSRHLTVSTHRATHLDTPIKCDSLN